MNHAELIERLRRVSDCDAPAWAYDEISDAADALAALVAERDALREALEEIAKQAPAKDMDEDYYDAADFEDGYDRCIFRARAALAQGGEHG